jgi:acylphosphatase
MFSFLKPYLKKLDPFLKKYFDQEPKVRAHIVVKGRIFDGSYHIFVEQQARNYGMRGWMKVRDTLSQSAFLELDVEAPDPTMQSFIMDLRKGTRDSNVTLVTVEMKPAAVPPYDGFRRLL